MARLIFFLILTSLAHAQLTPDLAPEFPESEPVRALPPAQRAENLGPVAEGTVLVNPLQVIHLHGPNDQVTTELRPGVLVSPELHIPSPRTLAARLADWLGGPLTDQSLAAMADLILAHYDAEGYPVVLVDAPEQDLSSGKIQILVEVGTIGRVGLSRSKFSESKILRDGLRLQTGELLRRGALEEQIAWYGRSPFRVPRLFVSPGLTPASADLLIGFEETKPWRAYVGYDNAGTELLGEDRFRIGVAGMTKGEQIIAWQSLVGAPISSLHAHALHWEIPFHKNHHLLRIRTCCRAGRIRVFAKTLLERCLNVRQLLVVSGN